MTDAQIALYAAIRVAIPTSWRVRFISPWRLELPGSMLTVECSRTRNHKVETLKHVVPTRTLEDPRYTEGTIALDVEQIVADLAHYDPTLPKGPLAGLFLR